jgi:hypothetical protein
MVTWTPMGSLVAGYCGVEPFAIDQTVTVDFGVRSRSLAWVRGYEGVLRGFGGSAGCLAGEVPAELAWLGGSADAYVLSVENGMVE